MPPPLNTPPGRRKEKSTRTANPASGYVIDPGDRLLQIVIIVVLCIGAIAMLAPFLWMIGTSLSRTANVSMPRVPRFFPPDPSLFNYQIASADQPILRFYFNSIVVVGLTTIGYLFFCSLAGYAFAKGRFPGKSFFFLAFLATLLIPFETRMIPLYLLMSGLHLNDTYAALILPFLAGGFGTFLMRQSMVSIPDELLEAARLDGAGEFRIFAEIVLPLVTPALASLAIINIIWRWNDVLWPLLVISKREMYTVTQGLAISGSTVYTGVELATAVMAILPVIIVYLILQRYIIRGFVTSGMKG